MSRAGIYVRQIVQFTERECRPIEKGFVLFNPDGTPSGNMIELKLTYRPLTPFSPVKTPRKTPGRVTPASSRMAALTPAKPVEAIIGFPTPAKENTAVMQAQNKKQVRVCWGGGFLG